MKPDPPVPSRWQIARSQVRAYVTWWPWQVHALKRAGFRRTGWMTWESHWGKTSGSVE